MPSSNRPSHFRLNPHHPSGTEASVVHTPVMPGGLFAMDREPWNQTQFEFRRRPWTPRGKSLRLCVCDKSGNFKSCALCLAGFVLHLLGCVRDSLAWVYSCRVSAIGMFRSFAYLLKFGLPLSSRVCPPRRQNPASWMGRLRPAGSLEPHPIPSDQWQMLPTRYGRAASVGLFCGTPTVWDKLCKA